MKGISAHILRLKALNAASQLGIDVEALSPGSQADKAVALETVSRRGMYLEILHPDFQADKEVVLAAVTQNACSLRYASSALRADKEVVMKAVAGSGQALEYASSALRSDREVVIAALEHSETGGGYTVVGHAGADLKADRDIARRAVTFSGHELEFVDSRFHNDIDIVSAAVTQWPPVLELAGDELLNNAHSLRELLNSLPQACLELYSLFRITILSGRSCVCVVCSELEHRTLVSILMLCAERLGLPRFEVVNNGQLLDGSTLIEDVGDLQRYESGRLHDLQLIVQSDEMQPLGD